MGLNLRLITVGCAATAALLLASAPASAGLAATALAQGRPNSPGPASGAIALAAPAATPCLPGQKTILMQSLESLVAAGSDAPAAQAAVLASGLVVLVGGGLLLKQQAA